MKKIIKALLLYSFKNISWFELTEEEIRIIKTEDNFNKLKEYMNK